MSTKGLWQGQGEIRSNKEKRLKNTAHRPEHERIRYSTKGGTESNLFRSPRKGWGIFHSDGQEYNRKAEKVPLTSLLNHSAKTGYLKCLWF